MSSLLNELRSVFLIASCKHLNDSSIESDTMNGRKQQNILLAIILSFFSMPITISACKSPFYYRTAINRQKVSINTVNKMNFCTFMNYRIFCFLNWKSKNNHDYFLCLSFFSFQLFRTPITNQPIIVFITNILDYSLSLTNNIFLNRIEFIYFQKCPTQYQMKCAYFLLFSNHLLFFIYQVPHMQIILFFLFYSFFRPLLNFYRVSCRNQEQHSKLYDYEHFNHLITHFQTTIEKLLKSYWNPKTKISSDASAVASEYLRLFVLGIFVFQFKLVLFYTILLIEALERARLESDNQELITPEAIQKILPQLLLDF